MARHRLVGVLVAVAVAVAAWALVTGAGSGPDAVPVRQVEAWVEQIRGLRFVHPPVVRFVTQAQMHKVVSGEVPGQQLGAAASDFTRPVPPREAPLVERLEALELLGAVPVGTTIGQLWFGAGADPGGMLDPRTGTVYVRRGPRLRTEISVLAHELTHALEYQHHLHEASPVYSFDELEVARALIEGPAVLAQYLYAERHQSYRGTLDRFLGGLSEEASRALHLPPVLLADAMFPYLDGARFMDRLWRAGGWSAVTRAERSSLSDTQSMLVGYRPGTIDPIFDVTGILGSSWRAEPYQPIGDFDSATLLAPGSLSLLSLWRGGALKVWNDLGADGIEHCRRPCGAHFVLLASWRWANAATAAAAAGDLRRLVAPVLADPTEGRTRLGSFVAIAVGSRVTTIALAPTRALADALARA